MLFPQKINVVASARHANPHNETVVVQNDTAVEFYVAVVGDNGQTELPEGATYTLVCLHLRKQPTEKLGTLQEDGNVMFKLTHMELSETGPVQAQVRVYHPEGGRLTSNPFIFHVAPDPTYGAEIKPEDQSIIEQVIGEGPAIIAEAKEETTKNITERARLTGAVDGALSSLADDKAQALLEMSQSKDAADQSAQVAQQAADNADDERERLTLEVSDKLNEVETARSATVEATGEATEAAGLARDEADAARLQKEEVQDILGAGPVASVNGETGVVTGLATQESVNQVTAQLAEKANEGEVEDFKDATGFSIATIISQFNLEPIPDPILLENIWKPNESELGNLSESTGNANPHETNRVSGFIPIESNENYSFITKTQNNFKVVWYDEDEVFISGHGWQAPETHVVFKSPENAKYMRLNLTVSQGAPLETSVFIVNIGDEIIGDEDEGSVWDGNFWGNVPTPPLRENSVKTHHYANKSVTAEKLTDEIAAFVSPTRKFYKNLWNVNDTVPGTLNESSGNITNHASNRTTNPIAVKPGEKYTFYDTSYKLAFFDSNDAVVQGFGWTAIGANLTYTVPANAAYMRITVQQAFQDVFVVNIGETLMQPDQEGTIYTDSFWDAMPDGTIRKRLLSNELLTTLNEKRPEAPFPQTLKFTEVYAGDREVLHLSRDGKALYFKENSAVYQSLDDAETMQLIGTPSPAFATIQAVRELEDGELLVSTSRNDSTELKSKVYKTSGYNRENPAGTQFTEVLEAISSRANIYGSWGLEAHDNICLASEYGLRDVDGARHVYLSTDYGDNWTMIFDQMTTTAEIAGAPTWTTSAHLHTVHYDRYWNRIWLVVGDNPNSATYYSDDLGVSWEHVPNSHVVQYTGIVSFPDGVVFGSDRAPNGLHVWKRTENKSDPVRIDTLKTINDESVITHVFQRAFRRYAAKGEVALFPATRVSAFEGVYSSVIMGFTNINNPILLYELDKTMPTPGLYNVVGVTDRGNILTSYYNGTSFVVVRAKAPVWE